MTRWEGLAHLIRRQEMRAHSDADNLSLGHRKSRAVESTGTPHPAQQNTKGLLRAEEGCLHQGPKKNKRASGTTGFILKGVRIVSEAWML